MRAIGHVRACWPNSLRAYNLKHYEVGEPGFKYNMMDLQAAIGIHQLARVEESLTRRQEIWAQYD